MSVERQRECGERKKLDTKPFALKKWNAVAMWSWDVECDTCAICRVQVMGKKTIYSIDSKVRFIYLIYIILLLVLYKTNNVRLSACCRICELTNQIIAGRCNSKLVSKDKLAVITRLIFRPGWNLKYQVQ